MYKKLKSTLGRPMRHAAVVGFCGLLALFVTACDTDEFLGVANEQDLLDRELDSPDAVAPVLAGVAGDYAVAYGNGVIITGLLGLEFRHVGSFPSWREVQSSGVGSRPSSSGDGMYTDFGRAMWVADDAVRRFREVIENAAASPEIAKAIIWGGFARLFVADNFCSATIDGGPEIPPSEVYQQAEARFDEALAIATAAGNTELRRQAIAGRARARLFQGDYAGALADAKQIPDGFVFNAQYSENSSREYNDPANMMRIVTRKEAGVHPRYFEDDRYINDPRTPFTNFGPSETGSDRTRQFVQQEKFPSRNSPIPVSNWQEARLMEAEAELMLGNPGRAVELINLLRTRVDLDPYDGPMTVDAIMDQLMYERSAELWIQGRLLKDMRRTGDPLLGNRDDCFEIGETEWRSNPNLGG